MQQCPVGKRFVEIGGKIKMVEKKEDRFSRTRLMLGQSGLDKLRTSKVTIIGLGAVGGYVVEGLARVGVGNLILIDFDKVQESNINRQIVALTSTVGQSKALLLRDRVKDINPDCSVKIKEIFVNDETMVDVLSEPCDFVVDAIDSLSSKVTLIKSLLREKIPFVSSMGAARRTDPSYIKIGSLNQITNCSLAKFVRKRLKRRDAELAFKCVYSDEPTIDALGETSPNLDESMGRERRSMGSLPTITAIFGLTIANYVIQKLVGEIKG